MRRRFAVLCAIAFAFAANAQSKPNIVLIMADDVGYECFGTYGSADYETPVLDGLAADGMRFDHCYSQPLCTPSRVKIMTGRYNYRNYQAFGVLDPSEVTFGHALKDAGYATCVVGKWQLYGRQEGWEGSGATPQQAGFDRYCLWQIAGRGSRYADAEIESDGGPLTVQRGAYGPDIFTDYLLDFVTEQRDGPFFAYFPMALVHNPFVPTPDSDTWADGDRHEDDTKYFADMMSYMDKIVGRIDAKLAELGIRENTVLMFTGDNGTNVKISSRMSDGRVIKGGKGTPTDAGTRVPFIVSWPGTAPKGTVSQDLICFSDFMPTLVEIAGGKLPGDRVIDGKSFAPQLRGEPGAPREWLFCHYDPQWGNRTKARFARTAKWKLFDDGRLYDMSVREPDRDAYTTDGDNDERRKVREMLRGVLDAHVN